MFKTNLFTSLAKAAACAGICLIYSFAPANQLETWSWTQSITDPTYAIYLADVAQAVNGRSYALYRVADQLGGHVSLRGYYDDGSQIFDVMASPSGNATAVNVCVSKPVNGAEYVFASSHYLDNSSHYHGLVVKYDSAGTFQWQYDPSPGTGAAYVLAVDTDSSGNVYLAYSFTTPTPHLEVVKLDPTGTLLNSGDNYRITPYASTPYAYHADGHWVVNGSDNNSMGTSSMWGVFSDTTATLQAARSFADKTVGSNSYHYVLNAQPFNGGVLDVLDMQITPSVGAVWYQHEEASYSYAGALNWHTNWLSGWTNPITTVSPSGPIYSTVAIGNHQYLQQISSTGMVNFTKLLPSQLYSSTFLAPDSTGCFVAGSETNNTHALLYRYDATGAGQWSTSPTGGAVTSLISSNGTTFISTLSESGGNQSGVVERFVSGVALSIVTTSAAGGVMNFGSPATATAYLNGMAAVNTSVFLHSNNPNLLFSNSTQDITITIPAGANHASATMNQLMVGSNQPAQVTAQSSGVLRYLNLTLTG